MKHETSVTKIQIQILQTDNFYFLVAIIKFGMFCLQTFIRSSTSNSYKFNLLWGDGWWMGGGWGCMGVDGGGGGRGDSKESKKEHSQTMYLENEGVGALLLKAKEFQGVRGKG